MADYLTHEEILEKATDPIKTSDFTGGTSGGLLKVSIANKFIDQVYNESVLKDSVRQLKIAPDQHEIPRVSVGSRVAVPKTEATDPGTRRGITTQYMTITCKPITVPWSISGRALARNIEGPEFENTVANMMAKQLANDLEELFLTGDDTSSDSFLALMDGWLQLAEDNANVYDAERKGLDTINNARLVLSTAIKTMPTKYRRSLSDLRFFVPSNVFTDYIYALSVNNSQLQAAALQGEIVLKPFGVPMVPIPKMPSNTIYGSPASYDNSEILLTHKDNLVAAIEVQYAGSGSGIVVLKDVDIYAYNKEFAMHLSPGCTIQEPEAVVLVQNVKSLSG